MPSVLAEVRSWAKGLPYWEQAALDAILAGRQLGDAEHDKLVQYLLEDNGLANSKTNRPPLQALNTVAEDAPRATEPTIIDKISNLENINALVPGQVLEFGPALTAIYGANGAGKSGYACVLGCAGFTRGDKQVLPDVSKPFKEDAVLCADDIMTISPWASPFSLHLRMAFLT